MIHSASYRSGSIMYAAWSRNDTPYWLKGAYEQIVAYVGDERRECRTYRGAKVWITRRERQLAKQKEPKQ